jgi:hypothetical protein
MPPSIHVEDWKIEGIALVPPDDQEFDSLVGSLFKGNAAELLKLKPFLTIISNRSPRTIVAYTLYWKIKQPNESRVSRSQYKYPDAVGSPMPARGNEIHSGEQKIVAMNIEINCGRWDGEATDEFYLRQFVDWFVEYADASDVHIGFDAVIFQDGEMIGPDQSRLGDHFAAYVAAKQGFYRSLVQSLDSGQSMDQAFGPIEAAIAANTANPRLDSTNLPVMWQTVAALEVLAWRRRYGDAALPDILRRALWEEQFVIRKRDDLPLDGTP